jgi:uncharacterized membrane protein
VVQRYPLAAAVVFVVAGFLAIPVPFAEKAHAAMHGICAQRPSHTIFIGSTHLPFDARMTGIYLGFATTLALLIATGRTRQAGFPRPAAAFSSLVLVGFMAVDGFNSLLTDLGVVTPYETTNVHRLITGAAAGTAFGIFLLMLVNMALWRRPQPHQAVVDRWWQPIALFGFSVVAALSLLVAPGWLALPVSALLMASAVAAFSALALVAILLVTRRENQADRLAQAQPTMVAGLIVGLLVIGGLAGLRFAFEAVAGVPPLV